MSKPKNTVSKRDTLAGLVQFGFEGEPVRMVMEGDMPWFNANDVCKALGYLNSRQTLVTTWTRGCENDTPLRTAVIRKPTSSTSPAYMP